MRFRYFIVGVLVFAAGAVCSAAQRGVEGSTAGDRFVGVWTGTWEGAGSGGFELTLERDGSGTIIGRVSITGEATYKAAFRTLSFDGGKMRAQYDYPPDEGIEVTLTASFEGDTANGTWSAREKANGNELASGTWTVRRT